MLITRYNLEKPLVCHGVNYTSILQARYSTTNLCAYRLENVANKQALNLSTNQKIFAKAINDDEFIIDTTNTATTDAVKALIARGHIRETEKRVPFSLGDKIYEFKIYRFIDQGLTAESFKINI